MTTTTQRYNYGVSGIGGGSKGPQPGFWNQAVQSQSQATSTLLGHKLSESDDSQQQPMLDHDHGDVRSKLRRDMRPIGDNTTQELNGTNSPSSEFDSQTRPYHSNVGNSRERSQPHAKRRPFQGAIGHLDDDDSKWIHRDKLAEIESRELAEMGYLLGRPSRHGSRKNKKSGKTATTADEVGGDPSQQQESLKHDDQRQQAEFPVISDGEMPAGELFRRDVVADEMSVEQDVQLDDTKGHRSRPSISRIPISKIISSTSPESPPASSVLPQSDAGQSPGTAGSQNSVSQHGRFGSASPETPSGYIAPLSRQSSKKTDELPRKSLDERAGSQNSISQQGRFRSASPETPSGYIAPVSRQSSKKADERPRKSLDERSRLSQTNSSPHVRIPSNKGPPVTVSRQVSVGRASSDMRRPRTSGGSRPPTARPEGEAPWIATMYKPDPRLPPEEQMLPTHAKRLAEEQMQKITSSPSNGIGTTSSFTMNDNEDTLIESNYNPRNQPDESSHIERSTAHHSVSLDPESQRSRDIQLINNHNTGNYRKSPPQPDHYQNANYGGEVPEFDDGVNGQWPLITPSIKSPSPGPFSGPAETTSSIRGRSTHSGYSVMPTIQTQREMDQRMSQLSNAVQDHSSTQQQQPGPQPTRMLDTPDPEKESKGCMKCCVVM